VVVEEMNREDVIRMACETGIRIASPMDTIDPRNVYLHELERFAQLVAAAEREACARECEIQALDGVFAPNDLADAIRARGNT